MSRKKKTEEEVKEEVTEQVTTENQATPTEDQVNVEVKEETPVENVEVTITVDEEPKEESKDEVTEDGGSADEVTEDSTNEEPTSEESSEEVDENTEVYQGRISILEHTFDKKVIERGIFDLYQKGNMWIFKDRNGRELSTHFGELEVALKLFVVRMFPLDKRERGSSFTWAEVE